MLQRRSHEHQRSQGLFWSTQAFQTVKLSYLVQR